MKLIIIYEDCLNVAPINFHIIPLEYKSKNRLIEDFRKIWKKQLYNFFFMGKLFIRLPIFEKYEILTLDEWFEREKITLNV